MPSLISIRSKPAAGPKTQGAEMYAYHRELRDRRRAWLGLTGGEEAPPFSGRDRAGGWRE